jgi:hypothetical protein
MAASSARYAVEAFLLAGIHQNAYTYLPGDANMAIGGWPPSVLSNDVTYLINYLRGAQQPCLIDGFFVAGDVNGDCKVLGNDVTRLVNYFRCLAEIVPCPKYESVWSVLDNIPDAAPKDWPNCAKITETNKTTKIEAMSR